MFENEEQGLNFLFFVIFGTDNLFRVVGLIIDFVDQLGSD